MGMKGSKLSKFMRRRSFLVPKGLSKFMRRRSSLVPKGYVPISVGVNGETTKHFVIHTSTLTHTDFSEFLCRSAEEFGYSNEGVLRIPYETGVFEEWMKKDGMYKMGKVKPI